MRGYDKWRLRLVRELKTNGCAICGYNKTPNALCFHHVDPSIKKFEIRLGRIRLKGLQEEVAKCILLCCNCHAEIEERMRE